MKKYWTKIDINRNSWFINVHKTRTKSRSCRETIPLTASLIVAQSAFFEVIEIFRENILVLSPDRIEISTKNFLSLFYGWNNSSVLINFSSLWIFVKTEEGIWSIIDRGVRKVQDGRRLIIFVWGFRLDKEVQNYYSSILMTHSIRLHGDTKNVFEKLSEDNKRRNYLLCFKKYVVFYIFTKWMLNEIHFLKNI